MTLALLLIKAKRGAAALFDSEVVRAYLTDFLPQAKELCLTEKQHKNCFAAALTVRVDYSELSNETLLAAAEHSDTEAMYELPIRYYDGKGLTDDDDNERHYFQYLHKAADAGHRLAVAQLELAAFSGYNDEYKI